MTDGLIWTQDDIAEIRFVDDSGEVLAVYRPQRHFRWSPVENGEFSNVSQFAAWLRKAGTPSRAVCLRKDGIRLASGKVLFSGEQPGFLEVGYGLSFPPGRLRISVTA